MSRDNNSRKKFGPGFWVSFYIMMIVLTGGFTWHRTCGEASRKPPTIEEPKGSHHNDGRFLCSAATGVVWPIYWATRLGIYAMDPDGPIFSFRPPSVRWE